MKLVTYGESGQERIGAVVGGEIVDLRSADESLPGTILAVLEEDALGAVSRAVESGAGRRAALGSVTLASPIPRPSKIVCVGLNYLDHATEQNTPLPRAPAALLQGYLFHRRSPRRRGTPGRERRG